MRAAQLGNKNRLGTTQSEETREKLRLLNIGKSHTLESREKMSKALIGNKRRLGKAISDEHRVKLSQAQLGKKHTAESLEKMRQAHTGLKFYNNGEITVKVRECPEGFVPGLIRRPKNTTSNNF